MEIDPIPNDVRLYLRKHFQQVKDEPSEGDYYVFSVDVRGKRKALKVHRNFFMFADAVPGYLRDTEVARQLEQGEADVWIAEPSH